MSRQARLALGLALAMAAPAPGQSQGVQLPGAVEVERLDTFRTAPGAESQGAGGGEAQGAAPGAETDPARPDTFRAVPRDADGNPVQYRASAPPPPELARAGYARLRLLDKMTGQTETLEIRAGETREADRLEIALRDCRTPADDPRRDAVAYLEIRDLREPEPRFAGWMFASSPALSALDHARYDVWVLSCSTVSAEESGGRE